MNDNNLEKEIGELKSLLREKEAELAKIKNVNNYKQPYGLCNEEIIACSRQIILPEIGIPGQVKLKNSSVLVVGVGGLGCPVSMYLAGCGIGQLGLVDYDNVELNNLHRQTLFTNNHIGLPKVIAAQDVLCQMNKHLKVIPYKVQIDSSNALKLIEDCDIVIDATDNVATRYLLNDSCVMMGKPLVSGSALRFEGQLTVYNYENGPCYRCIFPTPPPPETVTNCGDGGVLGPVVGTIGTLQALETVKLILKREKTLSGEMMIFDGLEGKFRNIKLRPKRKDCVICGEDPKLTKLIDYEQFCGAKANDKDPNLELLKKTDRVTVKDYQAILKSQNRSQMLIDVRSNEEFQICQIEHSINVPISDILKQSCLEMIDKNISDNKLSEVYVVCRRGNDSQKAVQMLKQSLKNSVEIKDIVGGIHAWAREIDNNLPIY